MEPKETPRRARHAPALLLLGTGAFLLARLPVLPRRVFDPDELEHAHAAWCLFRGMLPYKDFFEHHTPWYYYVLRPLFNWFSVDASLDAATGFLLAGRVLSFGLTALALALVVVIGRRWARASTDARWVGPLSALLLVSQPIFLQKTVEMRPDILALPLFLGALALLLRGLGEGALAAPRFRWFFCAGLSQGGAIMCTQKMLFVLPGLSIGLGLWILFGATTARARLRALATCCVLAVGTIIPAALTWAAFAAQGAGSEFITNNFLLNARWRHMTTNQGIKLLLTSGPVLALALLGAAVFVTRFRRTTPRDHAGLVLLCTAVGLFLGVVVMPVAHRQYYLMPLPIVCLFAARGLLLLVAQVPQRARRAVVAFAAVGLVILPLVAFRGAYRDTNDRQLDRLREVYQRTAPTDVVMDGWEGTGVFRPHAFHYYFLHDEAVAMLPPRELDAYLDTLESGAVRPKLIAMDKNLRSLGPRFVAFVENAYASSDGFFYYRRQP